LNESYSGRDPGRVDSIAWSHSDDDYDYYNYNYDYYNYNYD